MQLRRSHRLAVKGIDSTELYRDAAGFAFRIDSQDPFQAAMLLDLFDRQAGWLMARYARPGAVAIDVGAHLGYFTLRLARLVGPTGAVHAFEPDPRLYSRLCEHVRANGMDRTVTANEVGLLDRAQEAQPLALRPQLGWSSVVAVAGESSEMVSVGMTTLDSYVERSGIDPADIGFIKVDVEGAEDAVLRGAGATLAATSAAVLVEQVAERTEAAGHDAGAVAAFMHELGFSAFVPVRRRGQLVLAPGTVPAIGMDVLFLR